MLEFKKSNKLAKLRNSQVLGSQKVLLDMINSGTFDPSRMPESSEELLNLCSRLEINVTG